MADQTITEQERVARVSDLKSLSERLDALTQVTSKAFLDLYAQQKEYVEGQTRLIELVTQVLTKKEKLTVKKPRKHLTVSKPKPPKKLDFDPRAGITARKYNSIRSEALRKYLDVLMSAAHGEFVPSVIIDRIVRPVVFQREGGARGGQSTPQEFASKRAASLRTQYGINVESVQAARRRGVLVREGVEGYRLRPSVTFDEPMRDVTIRPKKKASSKQRKPTPKGMLTRRGAAKFLACSTDELKKLLDAGAVTVDSDGFISRESLRELLRARHG